MIIAGLPCYRRLHNVNRTVTHWLETDIDLLCVGVEPEEYEANKDNLVRDERVVYAPVVAGRGCGGDMRATADAMLQYCEAEIDTMIMSDDDVAILRSPPSVREWCHEWLYRRGYVCTFAFDQSNFWLRREWAESGIKHPGRTDRYFYQEVLRNQGPVLAFSADTYAVIGGYDANFPVGNDADIQQRFNLVGDSVVNDQFYIQKGSFIEGGMSAYYKSKSWGGDTYKRTTAEAVYKAKQKYPWMEGAGVTILKNGETRANWRTNQRVLDEYRQGFKDGHIVFTQDGSGLFVVPTAEREKLPLSGKDMGVITKLQERWPEFGRNFLPVSTDALSLTV